MPKKIISKKSPKKRLPDLVGIAALLMIAVCVTAVGVSASSVYVAAKSIPKKAPIAKVVKSSPLTSIQKALNAIKVKIPIFDLSSSPIPNLVLSPLNLMIPQLPGKGLLSNFSVDKNVGYQGGGVNIEMPEIDVSKYMPSNIPSGSSAGSQGSSAPPSNTPTTPDTSVPPATTPPAPVVDCSQFASVPSCSYTGAPGSDGYEACKKCYPSK
jgi:hypothetical protein